MTYLPSPFHIKNLSIRNRMLCGLKIHTDIESGKRISLFLTVTCMTSMWWLKPRGHVKFSWGSGQLQNSHTNLFFLSCGSLVRRLYLPAAGQRRCHTTQLPTRLDRITRLWDVFILRCFLSLSGIFCEDKTHKCVDMAIDILPKWFLLI